MTTISPRIILADVDVQSFTPQSLVVWANTCDTLRIRLFNGKPAAFNLSSYQLGLMLMSGSRATPVMRRPATETGPPSTTGITVHSAGLGIFDVEIQPTDFLLTDSAMTLEFYATKMGAFTAFTGADSGGSLAAGTYNILVTGVFAAAAETCGEAASATLAGGSSKVNMTWQAISGATSYNVYVQVDDEDYVVKNVGNVTTLELTSIASGFTASDPPEDDTYKALLGQATLSVKAG